MSESPNSGPSAPAAALARQPAYREHARSYDRKTGALQGYRQAVVEALPVRRGQVVLDVGCGTGLCHGSLLDKVGPEGSVVGIEESPEMVAVARERIEAEGWDNVTVVQSSAEDAHVASPQTPPCFVPSTTSCSPPTRWPTSSASYAPVPGWPPAAASGPHPGWSR